MKLEDAIAAAEKSGAVEALAKEMAEAVNGGAWDTHYVDGQKAGWRLKAKWAMSNVYRIANIIEDHDP